MSLIVLHQALMLVLEPYRLPTSDAHWVLDWASVSRLSSFSCSWPSSSSCDVVGVKLLPSNLSLLISRTNVASHRRRHRPCTPPSWKSQLPPAMPTARQLGKLPLPSHRMRPRLLLVPVMVITAHQDRPQPPFVQLCHLLDLGLRRWRGHSMLRILLQ